MMTWRWPWVSRAEYDRLSAELKQAAFVSAELYASVVTLSGANSRLGNVIADQAEEIAKLKLAAPAQVPLVPQRSEIDKVIHEQSEGNVALAKHLRSYARELRTKGFNDDQIVGELVKWTTTEQMGEG
jgi:hypothetical protein